MQSFEIKPFLWLTSEALVNMAMNRKPTELTPITFLFAEVQRDVPRMESHGVQFGVGSR